MRWRIAGLGLALAMAAAPAQARTSNHETAHATAGAHRPAVRGRESCGTARARRRCMRRQRTERARTVSVPLRFSVRNVNRTRVACPTDGADHVLAGRLVAPAAALRRPDRAVALYLHGRGTGEQPVWRSEVEGYHHVMEMATAGHASVVIDQLGYAASSIPDGRFVCNGGQADIDHQVVQALRSGDYVLDGGRGLSFSRVALVAHSLGVQHAIIEAATFRDVDALGLFSYSDAGPQDPAAGRDFVQPAIDCAAGGERKSAQGAAGWAHVMRGSVLEPFHDAEPEVVAATKGRYEQDACGELASAPATAAFLRSSGAHEAVEVPVFVGTGDHDPIAPADGAEATAARFDDARFATFRGTGHYLMLGRTAPAFRNELSAWLRGNGF